MDQRLTKFLLICTLQLSAVCVFAHVNQTPPPKHLSLYEAVMLSLRSNPQVKNAKLQRVVDKFSLEVARNEFEPRYTLQANGVYTRGEKPVYGNDIGVRLKSPFGTEFNVQVDSIFGPKQSNTLSASIKQPLLRGFGRDVTLVGLHNSYDQEKINQLALKDTVMSTITQVVSAYLQLVLDYNAVAINKQSLTDAQKTLEATKLQIKAGKVAETALTQQIAQVAQFKLSLTRGNNSIQRDTRNLMVLLGLNPHSNLAVDTDVVMPTIGLPERNETLHVALKNNVGYQRTLIGLGERYRSLMIAKNNQLWDLSLTASSSKDLRVARGAANDSRVTLGLDIPIDDKPRRQQLVSAKVGLKQFQISLENTKRNLVSQVLNSLNDLEAQRRQIALAEENVKYALKSLEVAQKKLKYGRSSMFEVTSLRQSLTASQQSLLSERINYLNTLSQFEQLQGTTLERWKLHVAY